MERDFPQMGEGSRCILKFQIEHRFPLLWYHFEGLKKDKTNAMSPKDLKDHFIQNGDLKSSDVYQCYKMMWNKHLYS